MPRCAALIASRSSDFHVAVRCLINMHDRLKRKESRRMFISSHLRKRPGQYVAAIKPAGACLFIPHQKDRRLITAFSRRIGNRGAISMYANLRESA